MEKRFISPKELAEYTGFAEQTIYHWVAQRRIPFYKFGKSVRFALSEITTWTEKHKAKTIVDFSDKI